MSVGVSYKKKIWITKVGGKVKFETFWLEVARCKAKLSMFVKLILIC